MNICTGCGIEKSNIKKFCSSGCYHNWTRGYPSHNRKYFTKDEIIDIMFKHQILLMRPGAIGEVYGCSMDPIRRILIEQKALRNLNKIPAKYDNRRGEKNTSWKGGVKTEIQIMYDSFEYKEFRKMIYKRDDYTCQFCGARGTKRLHCHHIYPVRDYPELFLVESNAITLCSNCHASTIGNEYQFERRCLEALS